MMSRTTPSGSGLPACWNEDMDRFICKCEALGDIDTRITVLGLKRKYPELAIYAISEDAVERRTHCLDQMDNNFFVPGMQIGVARAEERGYVLPPMNFAKYGAKNGETNSGIAGTDEIRKRSGTEEREAGMARLNIDDEADYKGESSRGGDVNLQTMSKENYSPGFTSSHLAGPKAFSNSASTGTFGYEYNPNEASNYSDNLNFSHGATSFRRPSNKKLDAARGTGTPPPRNPNEDSKYSDNLNFSHGATSFRTGSDYNQTAFRRPAATNRGPSTPPPRNLTPVRIVHESPHGGRTPVQGSQHGRRTPVQETSPRSARSGAGATRIPSSPQKSMQSTTGVPDTPRSNRRVSIDGHLDTPRKAVAWTPRLVPGEDHMK